MEVVPVIDLKGGVVVRARHGERAQYRPIETPLSRTPEPRDVVAGLLSVHPFRTLYVADLDAIEGNGDSAAIIAEIGAAFPGLALWIDNGCATHEAAEAFLARHTSHGEPLTSPSRGGRNSQAGGAASFGRGAQPSGSAIPSPLTPTRNPRAPSPGEDASAFDLPARGRWSAEPAEGPPPSEMGEGDHAQKGGGGGSTARSLPPPPPPPSAVPLPRCAGEEHPLTSLVLGSESQRDTSLVAALRDEARAILSLDFRGDEFLGPPALLEDASLWPERLIVMTLARVGSGAGPDLSRHAAIARRAGGRTIFLAGGLRGRDDLAAVKASGAAGILVASALHDGRIDGADLAALG